MRELCPDIKKRLQLAIDEFKKQRPQCASDLKHISVNVPNPYYDLKENFGVEIFPGIYLRANVRECWIGLKDNIVIFEDGIGLNIGFACVEFYK